MNIQHFTTPGELWQSLLSPLKVTYSTSTAIFTTKGELQYFNSYFHHSRWATALQLLFSLFKVSYSTSITILTISRITFIQGNQTQLKRFIIHFYVHLIYTISRENMNPLPHTDSLFPLRVTPLSDDLIESTDGLVLYSYTKYKTIAHI